MNAQKRIERLEQKIYHATIKSEIIWAGIERDAAKIHELQKQARVINIENAQFRNKYLKVKKDIIRVMAL